MVARRSLERYFARQRKRHHRANSDGVAHGTATVSGGQAVFFTGPASSTFFMRSMLFSSTPMLVANDARKCPGAPNPEPGTTATPASLMSISAKALSSLQPKAIIAAEQSAQA